MPFEPIGKGKYRSPSGRTFNAAQVRLYYANGGKFPGEKAKGARPAKSPPKIDYAKGLRS